MLNAPEVIVIGVVVFLFVGAKRMPELAKSLGQGIREFKKAASDATDEAMRAITEGEAARTQKAEAKPEISNPEATKATDAHVTSSPHPSQERKTEEQHL